MPTHRAPSCSGLGVAFRPSLPIASFPFFYAVSLFSSGCSANDIRAGRRAAAEPDDPSHVVSRFFPSLAIPIDCPPPSPPRLVAIGIDCAGLERNFRLGRRRRRMPGCRLTCSIGVAMDRTLASAAGFVPDASRLRRRRVRLRPPCHSIWLATRVRRPAGLRRCYATCEPSRLASRATRADQMRHLSQMSPTAQSVVSNRNVAIGRSRLVRY